jgi:hypothetical protein
MGHAFGLLGDEYATSTDICQVFELTPLFPNFSGNPELGGSVSWAPWLTLDGPFPNTTDEGTATDVGCFVPGPGGGLCRGGEGEDLVCRPQKTCKMKTNAGAFCAVCRNHLIKRIFRKIDLVLDDRFAIADLGNGAFRLSLQLSHTGVETTWSVDGVAKQTGSAYQDFDLVPADHGPGPHEVRLTVRYVSDSVRMWQDAMTETRVATFTSP